MNRSIRLYPGQLPLGQEFRLRSSGLVGSVGHAIGRGGQGTVYVCDLGGRKMALKWYAPETIRADAALAERIARLARMGAPDHRFVWPVDLADIPGRADFGYVMPLVSSDRAHLKEIVAPDTQRLDLPLRTRVAACFEIASSFLNLHARGLSYQDINFGSFFVDARRGSILICDTDNISPDGAHGAVYGTRKFMAPEVVRREALPSTRTDLFSLAVLFFYLICNWHPLDARSERAAATLDAAAEQRLYGSAPCFIFSPTNAGTALIPGEHDRVMARWKSLPSDLRALFVRSFTEGLPAIGDRVVETEWMAAMAHLRDAIVPCANCSFDVPLHSSGSDDLVPSCQLCGAPVLRPLRLAMERTLVPLRAADVIYPHQIDPAAGFDFETNVGVVVADPSDARVLGLRNLMAATWAGHINGGAAMPIGPGRTIRIVDGLSIDFRTRVGTVLPADPSMS